MLPKELDIAGLFPAPDYAAWRALVDADLKGASFERRLVTHTYEGLHIQPLYTAQDLPPASSLRSGEPPFTRAATPLGNAPSGWSIRQERAEADIAHANNALRDDLEGGVQSVVLRLDACARAGLDPRHPAGAILCGTDGIAAYSLADLDALLEGVHLNMIGLHLEAGAAFIPAAALLSALWEHRGVALQDCQGGFNADPLAVLAREGHLPYSLIDAFARLTDLAHWTSERYPHVRAVRVGTAPYHHAGATATQDLAFSMATALEYLRAMTDAGLSIDQAARQLEFSYAVGCHTFLALAKLRAARRLFARIIDASGGSSDAARMRMYVRPSKRVLTARDPWTNILRSTGCVFAAGLAQADAIGAAPFDAALGEPSPQSRRIARNTHHILMLECHLHAVCDPAGGSWYVERLTDDLAKGAWTILQAIESRGGMAEALTSGWISTQIDQARQPRAQNLATRKDVVVGVSDFPNPDEKFDRPAPIDRPALATAAKARLDAAAARSQPHATPPPARDPGWRTQWAFELARAGAGMGDIAGHLATPGQLPAVLANAVHVHPYAEHFERLRDASEQFAISCGHPPRVFLAVLGTPAQRLARTNYCTNLFEAGGFEVLGADAEGTPHAALQGFASSNAHIAVICGPDEEYVLHATALAPSLHRAGARTVVLAGNPGTQEQSYRAAGIDRFVFVKCDVVALLRELLEAETGAGMEPNAASPRSSLEGSTR